MLAQNPDQVWEGILYVLLLGLALVVAAVVIALAGKYRRNLRNDCLTASDQLAQFRSLYEEGAISAEEFNRLKGLLGSQLRQALNVPSKPATDGNPRDSQPLKDPADAPPREAPPDNKV